MKDSLGTGISAGTSPPAESHTDEYLPVSVFRLCASTADGIGPYFTDEGQGKYPG